MRRISFALLCIVRNDALDCSLLSLTTNFDHSVKIKRFSFIFTTVKEKYNSTILLSVSVIYCASTYHYRLHVPSLTFRFTELFLLLIESIDIFLT